MRMEKQNMISKWKKLRKDQILIGILAGVLLLVVAFPHETEPEKQTEVKQEQAVVMAEQDTQIAWMERKLRSILEQVQGVGKAQVMITVKSYGKKLVEKDTSISEEEDRNGENGETSTMRTENTTVYQRDGDGNEIPFVTEERAPEIEGVLVAAQGGNDLVVAENIRDAAMVLFGVEAHKIKVMKLN